MDKHTTEMERQTFRTLLDNASICAYTVDCQTNEILMINEIMARKVNKNKESLIGVRCYEMFPEGSQLCAGCPVKNKRFSDKDIGHMEQFQIYNYYFNEWLKIQSHLIKWHGGRDAVLVLYKEPCYEQLNAQDDERLDFRDKKFTFPNALCLEKDIAEIPVETDFTLICFDIVSLRTINEGYGRKAGDMFLFSVREWVSSLDLGQPYHLGSDEFCILLTGVDMETAQKTARHICDRFEKPWNISRNGEDLQIFCTVSMGIVSSKVIHSSDDILNVIERILKIASKQEEIAIYSEETDQLSKRRLEIEISLKSCVKNGMQGFSVHYQPIINSITGLWCGVEALCRWTSPSLSVISPLEFIPIAEQQGLIGAIGEWVLEVSVKQCKAWHLDDHEEFFLDVNLSPIQLLDESLDSKILGILKRCGYPSHKLSLEITESTQLNFSNHTLEAILRLTQQNIPVALDDFGTGYSSYNSLKNLPVSVLKTEKAFLDNIENDEYLQLLLETMVGLAHAAGMKMTAEGVETAEQMKILMDNRVDYVQGYLFSKPLPSEEFEEKLDNFYHKEENSIAGEYSRIDLNLLLNSENAYSLPPSLYKTLMRCMQILFNTPDINDGINDVLAVVGEKLGINRHVLFLKDPGEDTFTNTHEWCDDGTESNIGRFKSVNITEATPSFIPLFEREGMIVSADIAALPQDIYQMFLGIGVKSNIATPLWRGKELLGYVGLDACTKRRNWLPEEALMVHSVCGILANVLDRIYLQGEIIYRGEVLNSVLNNMDIMIYVSDLETDEILFANDALHKSLGAADSIKGKICWRTIHNCKTARCAFCKLSQLLEDPAAGPVVWEHVNGPGGRHYVVHDCIIQWENNKKAHLGYVVDIARYK